MISNDDVQVVGNITRLSNFGNLGSVVGVAVFVVTSAMKICAGMNVRVSRAFVDEGDILNNDLAGGRILDNQSTQTTFGNLVGNVSSPTLASALEA